MGPNSIWMKAVDLVGEEALRKLKSHGLGVVDEAAIARFLDEQRKSNERLRQAAAASMNALGVTTYRLEIILRDGVPTVIATAPTGEEQELARIAAATVAEQWDPPEGWQRRIIAPDTADRDTTDVDIQAKSGDEPSPGSPS